MEIIKYVKQTQQLHQQLPNLYFNNLIFTYENIYQAALSICCLSLCLFVCCRSNTCNAAPAERRPLLPPPTVSHVSSHEKNCPPPLPVKFMLVAGALYS